MTSQVDGTSDAQPDIRNRMASRSSVTHDYGSATAYAEKVRRWVFDTRCWDAFHQQNLSNMARVMQMNSPSSTTTTHTHTHLEFRVMQQGATGETLIQLPNGQRSLTAQYRCVSFIRRAAAELIDFSFMFALKLAFVFFLIDLDVIDLTPYEKLLGNEADLQTLIDATQDLFPMEMLGKVIGSFLEALCLSYGFFGMRAGATPGKIMMGIRCISAHSVVGQAVPGQVMVTGAERIPFFNALIRSLFKNLLINSLLPLSTVAFTFPFNRAVYDLLAKTIVVEM